MKKYIIVLSLLVSVILVVIITIFNKTEPTFKMTTIKQAYSYISTYDEEDVLDINVLINSKETKATNYNKFTNAYVTDRSRNNEILLSLIEIKETDESYFIDDEEFYLYVFSFRIPLRTNEEFSLEIGDAILRINYSSIQVSLEIGSFSYYKVPYYGDNLGYLAISKLKPLVNEVNKEKMLLAIEIGFYNNTNKEITIKRIVPLELNILFSLEEVVELDKEIFPNENLQGILGYSYQHITNSYLNDETNIVLEPGINHNFLFPLKYFGEYSVNKTGFLIEYEVDNQSFVFYNDDFLFYSQTYRLSDLKISTYENN
ncbi:MAG: hypothetical protein PHO86_04945 [Bacilli bacterium]|nr:hypothetical protein [Bacilli bacterium]